MPQHATGPAPGDGYCNYCKTADVAAFGVTTDEDPDHAGWKRCSQYKCRQACGVVKAKPKKEKKEKEVKPPKEQPAAKPASKAASKATPQAAESAPSAASDDDDDPNDIDPSGVIGNDSDNVMVALQEAHEILGHRPFDPLY